MGSRIASETRPVQGGGASIEGRSRSRLARNELIPGSRYELKRWIGEGGMGVIYEAEHVDVRRPVAVKILRPEYATNREVINSFRFEARATSGIDSPFLVDIYDYFELPDGRSALVMELLDGNDLSRRAEAIMPPSRVVGIGRQICKALQTVHDAGLVHRDLKPENIFVSADGHEDSIRVLDFGIARMTTHATTAQSGGTPLYTAPEVILGSGQGPKADIYALGCVLYEFLTGVPAFAGAGVDEILRAHLSERPKPPSEVVPGVPRSFDPVIMKAIAREPDTRFESMAALEAALCEAQISAGLTTAWDHLPLPDAITPEQRALLLSRMPDPSPTPSSSSPLKSWAAIGLAVLLGGAAVFALTRPDPDAVQAMSPAELAAQALAREARTAGSRAAWVYPSPNDVSSKTAYQAVLALETMDEYGKPLASVLRTDFADTLNELGDEYWDAEGGTRFAIAYYEQALLFEPDSRRALERSGVSKGSMDAFAERAAAGRFALEELVRVEPLIELAQVDEQPAAQRISKAKRRRRSKPAPAEQPPTQAAPAHAPEVSVDPAPEASPATAGAEAPRRDPAAAKTLVREARTASKSGNTTRAKLIYERALAKDARNPSAHAGLRDLAFDAGDYARAVRHGKRAAQLSPRNATHQLRLGDAYYRTRKYAEAEKAYAAAKKLGDTRAKWRLERAREKLGG
ncbi:MAG: protein kinase domain-containing protein [Nannocystaceae bacterium]|nr:protein kinase [bacterium]